MKRTYGALACAALMAIAAAGGGANAAELRRGTSPAASDRHPGDDQFRIEVLSSRPYLVSGGDALVRVTVKGDASLADVRVALNGANVTGAFTADAGAKTLTGLVSGMVVGANRLDVDARGRGRVHASLSLTNYPVQGPIISGPHETPFYCTTDTFVPFPGSPALGAPLDADCSVARRVQYVYRTTANTFAALPQPYSSLPADLATTTTVTGATVPYIVRLETGTINRAIYQTAILHNPNDAPASPTAQPAGWNKRLIYPLGGGCTAGWYTQGDGLVNPVDHSYLSQGYGVASASLNTFGNNCNDVLSSETILMVKERFIESYGVPLFTIGTGGSGGAYQSNQTGDNYPGTFDGIVTTSSFPDVTTGMIPMSSSRLLDIYFNQTRPGVYTVDQQKAISGYLSIPGMINHMSRVRAPRQDPDADFQDVVPAGVGPQYRYDPVTNPNGARATVFDHTVNVYGRVRGDNVAQRPQDNVGVQYGLRALNSGAITVDQFLDLNEKIGGFDRDFNQVPARTVADLPATRRAYEGGRILNGGNGLANMAVITRMGGGDLAVQGDVHVRYHAHAIRARLTKQNGNFDNQVVVGNLAPINLLIEQMGSWLAAVKADASGASLRQKVVSNKPADVVDACWTTAGAKIVEPQTLDGPGQCNVLFPVGVPPEYVAGSPIALDTIKCKLKAIDSADYQVPFTAGQRLRLRGIFPNGVCDWSKPGVLQVDSAPWGSYGPSPVNLLFDVTQSSD